MSWSSLNVSLSVTHKVLCRPSTAVLLEILVKNEKFCWGVEFILLSSSHCCYKESKRKDPAVKQSRSFIQMPSKEERAGVKADKGSSTSVERKQRGAY